MKIHKLLIMCICVVLGLSSCSIVKHNTYTPDRVQLNLSMDNLEYLGDTEVGVKYNQYIGIIRVIEAINGKPYDGKVIYRTNYIGNACVSGCSNTILNRALYKVFNEFPDADYIVISKEKSQTSRLFLGSEITVSAKVKVYKLK